VSDAVEENVKNVQIYRLVPFSVPNIRELSGALRHSTKLPDFGTGAKKMKPPL
jgi:hypothetical protein